MNLSKRQLQKILRNFIIITIFTLTIFYAEKSGLFKVFDDRTFDVFHIIEGEKETPKHVVLVEIDEATFLQMKNEPIAFWGPYFAKVVRNLKRAGAKTIGVDTLFTISIEAWFGKFGDNWEEQSRTYDIDFRQALSEGGVTLICAYASEKNNAVVQLPVMEYIYSLPNMMDDLGFANLVYDNDGIIRRFTHSYFSSDTPPYMSFAALLAKRHTNDTEVIKEPLGLNKIFYNGPPGTFRRFSFKDFLDDGFLSDPGFDILKEKIVIISYGIDTRQDMQQTPYATSFLHHPGRNMAGGEVHANIIETIINNKYLTDMSPFTKLIYMLIFSILVTTVFLRFGHISSVIGIFIFASLNVLTAYIFFRGMIYVPITATLATIIVDYLIVLGLKFTSEEKEKAYLRNVFEKYVSKDVVNKMVSTGSTPALGGDMQEVTILFSDIRNFTTISEQMEPHDLVEMLNRYFTIICDSILKAGGTVDKFIGDAIMVIFGAPLHYEDHAERALRSAVTIVENANSFKEWLKERFSEKYPDLPEFKVGVGLHSGNAITGNIGSLKRFEFTAIGDTVNIASRLEGLSKGYESDIIVSRKLLDKVDKEVLTGKSEMIKVKGKSVEIEVIEFISFK